MTELLNKGEVYAIIGATMEKRVLIVVGLCPRNSSDGDGR